jgi:diguanylate cyclase (GGDEF)-like protein
MDLPGFLGRRGRLFWLLIGLGLVAVLGGVDYLTGVQISLSLFYLLPIILCGWYGGGRLGLLISAVSALVWFIADYLGGVRYANSWIFVWNTLIRLGVFIIITFLLALVRRESLANQALVRTDFVTGALSPRAFYELAERELGRLQRQRRPLSLAYIDVDNFKAVNDQLGHSGGDRVLRALTTCFQNQTRASDLFARLGGDEFVLLLPETDERGARQVIGRIHPRLLEQLGHDKPQVTFSIGVVTFATSPGSVDRMIQTADSAMYTVKNSGKNAVVYSSYPAA